MNSNAVTVGKYSKLSFGHRTRRRLWHVLAATGVTLNGCFLLLQAAVREHQATHPANRPEASSAEHDKFSRRTAGISIHLLALPSDGAKVSIFSNSHQI